MADENNKPYDLCRHGIEIETYKGISELDFCNAHDRNCSYRRETKNLTMGVCEKQGKLDKNLAEELSIKI